MKFHFLINKYPARCGILVAGLFVAISTGAPSLVRAEALRWEDTLPALRIQVDAQRNRVWILTFDAVYLYNISNRRLLKRVELPNWAVAGEPAICAPDLALTPSGTALVTSNVTPAIFEIDPKKPAVRVHRIALDADDDKDVGFTGLAFDRGGRDLFGVSSLHGSAWRIDLVAGKAHKVRLTDPIRGACGVAVLNRGTAKAGNAEPVLCIAGAGAERRISLTADVKAGRVSSAPCD